MTTPISIESVDIQGFRAYLKPQSFSFYKDNRPCSLAIFAPNAKGKSSLVDAFEYYFSEDATLDRLGRRAGQAQAGPTALEHVRANDYGVESYVHFKFRQGADQFGGARRIADGKGVPVAAQRVLSSTIVPFVIHGYELRSFVDASAEDRYQEMASWFSLGPLVSIQRNLRSLQRQIKTTTESQSEVNERLRDLKHVTSDEFTVWNESDTCKWFNTQVLSKLDPSLALAEISETDGAYLVLIQRKEEEEKRVGLATLKTLITQIEALSTPAANDRSEPTGLVIGFENSVSDYDLAITRESNERDKAGQAVFNEIWSNAHSLFEMENHDFDTCPVCDTEFKSTPHGSRDAVRISINAKRTMLTAYRQAEAALRTAREQVSKNKQTLTTTLSNLCTGLADAGYEGHAEPVVAYHAALDAWNSGPPLPHSTELFQAMVSIHSLLTEARDRLVMQQGENTYSNAQGIARDLVRIKDDLDRIKRTQAEIQKLYTELEMLAKVIETAIVNHIQQLFSKLESDVDGLYKKIQGIAADEPAIVRLQLADENAANQQQVRLVIDYSDNRKGVAPTGYLSDSQIHTVALALRLAAIRTFNADAPTIILDDVVTSYDADHRKTIAATLAEQFVGFQIVVVTHDEQFFNLLRDHQPESGWRFRRITNLDPVFGPVYADHRTPDDLIDGKLDVGESAGEYIRMSEEEWLLQICRDFGVSVTIRPIERPFLYQRAELASALAGFLKDRKLVPPRISGNANSFLSSLQTGVVENFASHFSDNPHQSASVGDEKARWEEFKSFRNLFVCSGCGRSRFKRPSQLSNPVCKHPSCEVQFAFQVA